MKKYEVMYIVDPVEDEGNDEIKKKIEGLITGREGQIVSFDKVGKKRLAYPVERRQYGTYYLLNFIGDGKIVQSLDGFMRLNTSVLRHIILAFSDKEMALKEATEKIQFEEAERMRRGGKPLGVLDDDDELGIDMPHIKTLSVAWDEGDDDQRGFRPARVKRNDLTAEPDSDEKAGGTTKAESVIQSDDNEKKAE